jgi:hypothetical protein
VPTIYFSTFYVTQFNQSAGKFSDTPALQYPTNHLRRNFLIMARTRENGSLTGSKAYQAQQEAKKANSLGTKAKKLAESAGTALSGAKETLQPVTSTISNVASAVTQTAATTANTLGNIKQALSPTGNGYQHGYASSSLQHQADVYGG